MRLFLGGAVLFAFLLTPLFAQAEALISQGYAVESNIPIGSMVSLKNGTSNVAVATSSDSVNSIIGVVISSGTSQLSLSSGSDSQVQVASSGVQQLLVSDINGKIESGDQITASPIKGVGMKATASAKVVGVAQGAFPNSTATKTDYTDKDKVKHTVKLGQIPVVVNVTFYYKQPDKTLVPQAIQNIANALAGKQVNTIPILISVGIFIVTLVVVISIVYSLIHSSIISVGRNPMSQAAVYRNVIQLSLVIVVILAVSILAIYMVLRKL